MEQDPFALVKQFDAMRNSIGVAPARTMEKLQPSGTAPTLSTYQPAAARTQMPQSPFRAAGRLVPFAGKKLDESVLPYAQELTSRFGLRLTSGYRDPHHNRKVGGVKNSYHLSGRALDLVGSARAMQDAELWARQNGAREALRHAVPGGGFHLHVAW